MCGIAGVKRFGTEPITVEEIRSLLLGIEHRGNHATGMALVNPDHTVHVFKQDTPAWRFVNNEDTLKFLADFLNDETKTVILHTRWATQGNPKVNQNNHPMFLDKVAAVHNGTIHNDTFLFNNEKVARSCETDSDIIRALLDKYGFTPEGVKALNRMSGSAAIAAINPDKPDELFLARSGSPIKYAVSDEKFWWASELPPLTAAVRPWVQKHGFYARTPRYDVSYMTMPDNTAYIINDEGMQTRMEFKSCSVYRQPTYSALNTSYATKRRDWNREFELNQSKAKTLLPAPPAETLSRYGQCPGCDRALQIPAGKLWAGYRCTNKRCDYSKGNVGTLAALDKIV